MRRTGCRAGLVGAALLLAAVPVVSSASTGALLCPVAGTSRPWQLLPVPAFAPPQGVDAADALTAAAVGPLDATVQIVTNGSTVKGSNSNGCGWLDVFSLDATGSASGGVSGAVSVITALTVLPGGGGLLAVR